MIQFELHGQLKGGKDNIQTRRDGRRFPLPEFVAWRADAVYQIRRHFQKQGRPIPYFDVPLKMTVQYWASDKRRRNVTALLDGLFHAFEVIRLVEHDELFLDCDWQHCGVSAKSPRAVITIEEKMKG